MKILLGIPGKYKTVPMGRFCYELLQEMGHEVLCFDTSYQNMLDRILFNPLKRRLEKAGLRTSGFYRFLNNNVLSGNAVMNRKFRKAYNAFQPEVYLTLYGFNVDEDILLEMKESRKVVTGCWWLNDPFQFSRSMERAHLYNYYFTNAEGSVAEYRKQGIDNAYFVPTANYPSLHKQVSLTEEERKKYECDVCFAGDWHPLREKVMLKLVGKYDVKIFGPWTKKIPADSPLHEVLQPGFFSPEDMVKMYNGAKIVFNIHTWSDRFSYGLNPRVFEVPACGGFQLVDYRDELPELFQVGEEIVSYRDIDEIPGLIDYYLEHEEERQRIAKQGMQRAVQNHSYRNRLENILELMV